MPSSRLVQRPLPTRWRETDPNSLAAQPSAFEVAGGKAPIGSADAAIACVGSLDDFGDGVEIEADRVVIDESLGVERKLSDLGKVA